MQFRVDEVPFSRFGSYMALGFVPPVWHQPGMLLRTMHGVMSSREVFRVEPVRGGRPLPYRVTATPTLLTLEVDGGAVEVCFAGQDEVRLRARGVGVRLSSVSERGPYAFPAGNGRWQVNSSPNRTQYILTALRGDLAMDAPMRVQAQDARRKEQPPRLPLIIAEFTPDADGVCEAAVEEFITTAPRRAPERTFDECLREVEAEWKAWLKRTPAVPGRYRQAAELAMYVNWSAVVHPAGCVRRPTMLMSKNWMNQCWSWDHCFNAIAHSYRDPDLAWDQLMTLFDHQDEHGCLPDAVSSPAPPGTSASRPSTAGRSAR